MTKIHKDLSLNKWFNLSLFEQLANIGMDVERTIRWRNKENAEFSKKSFERVLELLDFTIADPKNRRQLKEIMRVREALVDHFVYDNEYASTDDSWQKYFFAFNYAVAVERGK